MFKLKDVKRVLDAFADGVWDRVHLRDHDSELLVSALDEAGTLLSEPRISSLPTMAAAAAAAAAAAGEGTSARLPLPIAIAAVPRANPAEVSADPGMRSALGTVDVVATSLGIFWRRPSPTSPEFVSIGDDVADDTTVCIIEVMKLMQQLKAGTTGRVVEILPDDGETIQAGQVLFRIEPR